MISRQNRILFIALCIIALVIYNKWIFTAGIISHGDWGYYFKETQNAYFQNSFSLWRSLSSFGGISLDVGQGPTNFYYAVLSRFFNLDFNISERIVHLWPIVFFTLFSSFILLQSIFKNRVAIGIGVLVYMYNTYFLTSQTGHLTLMAAYSIAPLVLYSFMRTLEEKRFIWGVITGLIFAVCGAYEPRASYIVFGLLGIYFVFFLITLGKTEFKFKNIINISLYAIVPFVIFAFLNVYWVYALATLGGITSNALFSRSLYGSDLFTIMYSLTLYHPFWTGTELKIYAIQPIFAYFWLYPVLAVLGLMLHRLNKKILFFGLISIIGIFLSKQADVPFPNMYSWLYSHFPGFNAFREASKFYFLTALGYSVLIGAFFSWIWDNSSENRLKSLGKYLITIVIIFVILLNTFSYITGGIGTLFKSRQIPHDFLTVKDFILKQNNYFRVLWVPVSSRWSIYTDTHPKVSVIDLVNSDWKNYVDDIKPQNSDYDNITRLFADENTNQLLDLSSIKYVIVSIRVKDNEEDWIGSLDNRREYVRTLDNVSYLKRIDVGTKSITVYENENYRPHLYLSSEKGTNINQGRFDKVVYVHKSPTEYSAVLKNITGPTYLNFSETFHSGWKLRVGKLSWLDALLQKNYFLSDEVHSSTSLGYNTYLIDPKKICKEFSCKRNSGNSYDIPVTLFFRPQLNLYVGMGASAVALVLITAYITYYVSKKRNKKK